MPFHISSSSGNPVVLCRTFNTAAKQAQGKVGYVSIFSGPEGVSSVCFNGFQMSGPSPNSNLGERFLRNISPYPSHPVTASVNTPLNENNFQASSHRHSVSVCLE